MNNITYTQGVESGKFVFKLFSTETGNKSFQIALNFSYAANGLSYDSISFNGSSSVSTSASNVNGVGSVNITGQVSTNLVAGEPFAVINFIGDGSGTFDLNVTRFVLDGLSVNLGNPPPISYNMPNLPDIQSVKVLEDKTISGVFNPFNSFFGYQIAVDVLPKHGELKIVSDFLGNQSWVYTPLANYNGSDVFSIKSTSGNITKVQQLNVTISRVNDLPTGSLTINGVLKQGETLTATNNLADVDGLGAITYQWQSTYDGTNWLSLSTGSTYKLQEAQVGKQIKVIALYTDDHGTSETVSSAPSSAVANVNDTPTGSVLITGALKQGETLKATNSIQDLDGVGAITYQWQSSSDGINWINTLLNAGDTFTLSESEVNRQMSVIATYTDGHGTSEKLTSSATGKLSANFISGTTNSDLIQGTTFADNISAFAGNDTIAGGLGSDVIDGGTGIDTVKFSGLFGSGSLANYSIQRLSNGSWSVSYVGPIIAIYPPPATDGIDSLTYVERIQFTDKSFALDLDGNAGITAKIIGAVLGVEALKNPAYVGIGLSYLDKGMSYSDLGALALNAVGAATNDDIVSTLWLNVIGSPASALDKAPFIKMLADGMKIGDLVALAADTAFNTSNINLVGLAQAGIEYIPMS